MDLFGRFRKLDSSLQRGLDNGFARVFGGEVVPAEIDELLKQEAEDTLMEDRSGVLHAPSVFEVHVASRDHGTLLSQRPDLDRELSDRLGRFIRNEGWSTAAPVTVDIVRDDSMHTGQLKCRSAFTSDHTREVGRDAAAPQPAARSGAPEWPRSEPDSGRSPVARPYDADDSDAAHSDRAAAGGAAPGAVAGAGAGGAGGAVAGAGALAGLAHPQRRPTGWGQRPGNPSDDRDAHGDDDNGGRVDHAYRTPADNGTGDAADGAATADPSSGSRPAPLPTEVVPGPTADAVNGVDGLSSTGSGGYQSAAQHTVTLHLRDGSNRTYELRQGSNTVGRGNQVDFRLPDTGVSRRHADISWDGYDAVLTDLNSTNGTTVNEIPVENWLLADGDVISLGHSEIEVRFS